MNPETIILICALIGFVSIFLLSYFRGRSAISIFPDINSVNILFREKGASGMRKHKNLFKKGGAKNVLEIVITEDELWVKTWTIMAGTAERVGLLQKLNFNQIKSCAENGRNIDLQFESESGEEIHLVLDLKDSRKFLDVLGSKLHTTSR